MRFEARNRQAPKQKTSISLAVFLLLLAMISLAGYKGFAHITTFLQVAPRHIKSSPSRDVVPVTIEPESGKRP
jgi:N-acyl-L-homoserine lactone synthetase